MTLRAIVVVFPVCLAQQATIRFLVQLSSVAWYGNRLKPMMASVNSVGSFRSLFLISASGSESSSVGYFLPVDDHDAGGVSEFVQCLDHSARFWSASG